MRIYSITLTRLFTEIGKEFLLPVDAQVYRERPLFLLTISGITDQLCLQFLTILFILTQKTGFAWKFKRKSLVHHFYCISICFCLVRFRQELLCMSLLKAQFQRQFFRQRVLLSRQLILTGVIIYSNQV